MSEHSGTLEQITTFDCLMAAWKKVRANRGAAGLDRMSIARFEEDLEDNLDHLGVLLREGRYLPLPPRHALIPKVGGGWRPLGILSVEDRVAQRAVLDTLEPICERMFLDCSYGYRPGRSTRDAARAVLSHYAAGNPWIVDADIEDFFGQVAHDPLLEQVIKVVEDDRVRELCTLWVRGVGAEAGHGRLRLRGVVPRADKLWRGLARQAETSYQTLAPLLPPEGYLRDTAQEVVYWLIQEGAQHLRRSAENGRTRKAIGLCSAAALLWSVYPVMSKWRGRPRIGQGILQGAPLSPLLANLYLHPFDQAMIASGHRLVRYADDLVVLCAGQTEAEAARDCMAQELANLGLQLNSAKTRVLHWDDGLEFLGYTFSADGAQMGDDPVTRLRMPGEVGPLVRQRVDQWAHSAALRKRWSRMAAAIAAIGSRLWPPWKQKERATDADALC